MITITSIMPYKQAIISHQALHLQGFSGRRKLARLIMKRRIQFAGNRKLKIYGSLSCASGKRMKITNRVFFTNEEQAIDNGYRPCAHCMRNQYLLWRQIK